MRKYLIISTLFILSACTYGAMSPDEVEAVDANCSNVNETIHMLEQEKIDNDNRMAAGAGNIMPVTALFRLVTGRYETNTKITTGEWEIMIDKKLSEMRELKKQCQM